MARHHTALFCMPPICKIACTIYFLHSSRFPAVRSGKVVGLKYPYLNQWLSCAGRWCDRRPCPERFFSKPNSQCWGEVFYIHSQKAYDQPIKVGDKIGLYYPRESKWFGCEGRHCGKYSCPGRPSYAYGFQDAKRWRECWGEVFTIYAYGKKNAEYLTYKDAVMLYYNRERRWVSVWGGKTDKRTCPGNTWPPPSTRKYDQCAGEAFEIYLL